ncbi:unnamed protein product [Prunus armeniaca]|uniref:Uncharacterized protein n=1 Tax=Prunus armeniaca TaxID=36596 RepID=A0A6J5WUV4_PRUAR|nr:unnamed protein product [Prunus armeniaca]
MSRGILISMQNVAVDGMYFEDVDDEFSFAPMVEMLDDPSSSVAPAVEHLFLSFPTIQHLQFHPMVEM